MIKNRKNTCKIKYSFASGQRILLHVWVRQSFRQIIDQGKEPSRDLVWSESTNQALENPWIKTHSPSCSLLGHIPFLYIIRIIEFTVAEQWRNPSTSAPRQQIRPHPYVETPNRMRAARQALRGPNGRVPLKVIEGEPVRPPGQNIFAVATLFD